MNQEKRNRRRRTRNEKLISIVYLAYYAKKICKHLLDNGDRVSVSKNDITMANVASNNTNTTPRPLMDRLTHAVIKETSKNL